MKRKSLIIYYWDSNQVWNFNITNFWYYIVPDFSIKDVRCKVLSKVNVVFFVHRVHYTLNTNYLVIEIHDFYHDYIFRY